MFQDSLLENVVGTERRRLTRVISFLFEALLLAVAVIVPLLEGVAVPRLKNSFGPPIRGDYRITKVIGGGARSTSPIARPNPVEYPSVRRPQRLQQQASLDGGPTGSHDAPFIPGFPPGGGLRGVPFGILDAATPFTVPPPPRPASTPPIPLSGGVSEGFLVHKVQPVYPRPAIIAHVQGTVVLAAVIGRDGIIENLRVLSGHPMLAPAALDAVRQWRYRPYRLGNEPVEVETQITVNFKLGGE